MSLPRVVVTGVGILSNRGMSFADLKSGMGITPASSMVAEFEYHTFAQPLPAFKLSGFDAAAVLGKAGLRTKDWATKVLLGAIELGFKDTLASFTEANRPGLCIGTAFGSVQSIGDFLSDSIVNGVNSVNPQLFANTVINAPTSNVNIRHVIRTLSSTIGTGFNAGLDALIYSRDYIQRGYLQSILAGGVEEISYYALAGLLRSGALSPSGRSRPFAVDADGCVMGEGCAVALLETLDSARARGVAAMAEVVGTSMVFDPSSYGGFNPQAEGAIEAVKQACAMAGISPSDIGFVAASANGNPAGDAMEATMLRTLLPKTPIAAYKATTGECYGASAVINTICALADLTYHRISGAGTRYDNLPDLNLIFEETPSSAEYVLINAFSCDGGCSCVILKRSV